MNKKTLLTSLILPVGLIPNLTVFSCSQNSSTENKSEADLLKDHLKELKWQVKENVNLNQVASSSIQTEADLLTYFDLKNKNENKYFYKFRFAKPDVNDVSKLQVEYQVILKSAPNAIKQSYRAILSGFRLPNAISSELEQIAQKATFDLANKQRLATEVQADEIKWNQKQNYPNVEVTFTNLKANNVQGRLGFDVTFIKDKIEYTMTVTPNSLQAIGGFQMAEINLDQDPTQFLKLPPDAKSFKGKLKKIVGKPTVIDNKKFTTMVDQYFTWDKFIEEMVYQLRFMMWQQYSDNFSEIDYYIYNEERERNVVVEAQGIIKEDVTINHRVLNWDDLGEANGVKTTSYKSGEVVKITFRSRWDNNSTSSRPPWRPMSPASAGYKASFATPPDLIPTTKQPMFLSTMTKWYVYWNTDQQKIYNHNTMNLRGPLLTLWYTYREWK